MQERTKVTEKKGREEKASKVRTYNLMLSNVFPVTHAKAGEETHFREFLGLALQGMGVIGGKFHTIRANYELWRKRFDEIMRGEAILSVRQWTGKPYRSKQRLIRNFTKDDGIGIQRLDFENGDIYQVNVDGKKFEPTDETLRNIAINDGLSYDDWREWFKGYDLTKPLAIIQFTKYRY